MASPFLRHLKQQNDQYGQYVTPSSSSAPPLAGLKLSTTSHPAPPPAPPSSTPPPHSQTPSLTSQAAPSSPRGPKPAGTRPLPTLPPKPAALQRQPAPSTSTHPPRPSSPKRAGFSQPPASYAAAQQQVTQQPDWSREHARAERTFPDVRTDREEPRRPVRTYEEASSSYVGGMAKLNLDSAPSIAIEPPSISVNESPSISVDEPPSISVNDAATPSFSFTADDAPSTDVPRIVSRSAAANKTAGNGPNALVCAECGSLIAGKIVTAMGLRFHPGCFKCAHCSILLEHVAFHERDGLAYCHVDFHELFTIRCDHCKTPIIDEDYITIHDPALGASRRNYHQLHAFCAECGDTFVDPKSLARKSAISTNPALREGPDDERPAVEVRPFVVHQGYPYCESCDIKMRAPKCGKCRKPIAGDILKALGRQWHDTCFVCEDCGKPFETSSFFARADAPYCERCYTAQLRREM